MTQTQARTTLLTIGILTACQTAPVPAVDAGPSVDAPSHTIAFTLPSAGVEFVRGTVRLQLVTTGPDPDRVELWQDGALLVVLTPPYSFDWMSDADPEGDHTFEARALVGTATAATAERRFTSDRTPPLLVEARPIDGIGGRLASPPIEMEFSEPLDPTTVNPTSVVVQRSGADVAGTTRALSADGATIEIVPGGVILPADIAVSVSTAIADRAGNTLTASATHEVHYAAFVGLFPPGTWPTDVLIYQMAVSGTDVYLLHGEFPGMNFAVSRWDGSSLVAMPALPTPAITGGAQILVGGAGQVLATYGVMPSNDIHVIELGAAGWVEQPVLAGVATSSTFRFALRLGPSDELVISRKVGVSDVEVMRLASGTWARVGTPVDQGVVGGEWAFTLDEGRPILGFADGRRCTLVADSIPNVVVDSGSEDCRRALVIDTPGPGVDALLSVRTGTLDHGERWVGPSPFWQWIGDIASAPWIASETPTGYVAVYGTVVGSDGRDWGIPEGSPGSGPVDVDEMSGQPIVAYQDQLYVPAGL